MAEFSMFDASQATTDAGWWATRSKKAPMGCSGAYNALVSALEKLDSDRCYETAEHAKNSVRNLRDTAQGLPLIKSKVKPNTHFFTALQNCYDMCAKISIQAKSERQSEKQRDDTISGKGSDGGDRSSDWAGING